MKNNTISTTESHNSLSNVFAKIHNADYRSVYEIQEKDETLFSELQLALYTFLCEDSFSTLSNSNLIYGSHGLNEKYGCSDVNAEVEVDIPTTYIDNNGEEKSKTKKVFKVIGIKNGDRIHDFYLKTMSEISKGKNKDLNWLDKLFQQTEYEYWIGTVQTSVNNFLLDEFKKNAPSSYDDTVKQSTSSSNDEELCIRDIISKKTPNDASYSVEEEAICQTIIDDIVPLFFSAPDELIPFAAVYISGENLKAQKVFNEMQAIGNSKVIFANAIISLCPRITKEKLFSILNNNNIDYSTIDRVLHMTKEAGAAELSRALDRGRKLVKQSKYVK